MNTRAPTRRAVVSLLVAAVVLAVAAVVTYPLRADLYRAIAGGAADLGGPVATVIEFVSDPSLIGLVAVTAGVAVYAWWRGTDTFLLLVWAGIGTVAAYLSSEVIKMVVLEERPCRTYDVVTVAACPDPGDWSWPSNHSAIAAAFATACILVAPRVWPVVAPWAVAIAFARVGVGAHYVHDVAAGMALGVGVTCAVALLMNMLVQRVRFGDRLHRHARIRF